MAGSTVSHAQSLDTAATELAGRLVDAVHAAANTTYTWVSSPVDGLGRVVRRIVHEGEALAPRGLEAATWMKMQVVHGYEYVETGATGTVRAVADELQQFHQKTRSVVDRSVAAGLHKLGVTRTTSSPC